MIDYHLGPPAKFDLNKERDDREWLFGTRLCDGPYAKPWGIGGGGPTTDDPEGPWRFHEEWIGGVRVTREFQSRRECFDWWLNPDRIRGVVLQALDNLIAEFKQIIENYK